MQNENEQQLSRLAYALLARLTELYERFQKRGELGPDGSIFQSSELLSQWLHCTITGLRWARNILIKANKIRYEASTGRGHASHYWVLGKKPKQKREPIPPEEPLFRGTRKGTVPY